MGRRERRRERKKQVLMTWFLIGLMVVSVAGIIIGNTSAPADSSFDYNGFEFKLVNNYYMTKVEGVEKKFYNHPLDAATVDIPEEAVRIVRNSPAVIVTFNPYSKDVSTQDLARYELELNLGRTVYSAVTQNSTLYAYPVITCENASPDYPVIYLEERNETSASYQDGCLVLKGESMGLLKGVESLIYRVLGVIE